ncbi:hypothetical protein THF1C08_240016 [Vibrio jasicida]|uniref:Uncharacterized protein n=1 Tax=Vibrio jasicida TaxID=766224 RepID=A0AAU9QPL9_9VIBR|nr:hypothetical protein THF1C08_240016 [Vibrio jasicida]CAH1591337.1 hypothetical protein THF1A12_240016 [Vibrio jasicida]
MKHNASNFSPDVYLSTSYLISSTEHLVTQGEKNEGHATAWCGHRGTQCQLPSSSL